MRIAFFAVLSVACSTAAAHCLTDTSARRVAENFRSTVADYSPELADRVFSVNFTDYADSVNELMNNGCPNGPKPLGSVSKTQIQEKFQSDRSSQPFLLWKNLKTHNLDSRLFRLKSSRFGIIVRPCSCDGGLVSRVLWNLHSKSLVSLCWRRLMLVGRSRISLIRCTRSSTVGHGCTIWGSLCRSAVGAEQTVGCTMGILRC